MMNPEVQSIVQAQGGGYGPPPGGYGPPGGAPPPGAPGMPPGAPGMPPGAPPGGVPMGPPGGAPMAPPGGGPPPGMPGGVNPELEKKAGMWFIISIVSIFCFGGLCFILPVVATWMSYSAKQALQQGDVASTEKNLKIAKICLIITWIFLVLQVIGLGLWLAFGGLALLGLAAGG